MLTPERLKEIVVELVTRPGHEKVRTLVYDLLVNGLGASSWALDFEKPLREVVQPPHNSLTGWATTRFVRNAGGALDGAAAHG